MVRAMALWQRFASFRRLSMSSPAEPAQAGRSNLSEWVAHGEERFRAHREVVALEALW